MHYISRRLTILNYIYFSIYPAICKDSWGRILIIVTEGVGSAGTH
jgi:hypothetical protein